MSNEPTMLRKASMRDLPLLMAMELEYARDQRQAVVQANPRLKPHMRRRGAAIVSRESSHWFRKCLRSRNCVVSVAQVLGKPVGYSVVSLRTNPPMRALRRYGNIDVLFVRHGYRGKGISTAMMRIAVAWFRKRAVKHVGLEVISDNVNARAIYKKWGFYDFFVEMRKEL